MRPTKASSWFARLAKATSHATGRPASFVLACAIVLTWAATGPLFQWSDTWQLIINTGTTIATFLMVFLIQNTQNRDTESLQIKLDELIRVTEGAHNALLDLEELEEREFDEVRSTYRRLARSARENLVRGIRDTGRADLEGDGT
ncbi:MAG TPA: low affinity iron permease family protein [Myxococcota bacterium]|nr:low affinity iron permease family protein [Myxococcota bacterium]